MEVNKPKAIKSLNKAAFFILLTFVVLCTIAWMIVFQLTTLEKLIILLLSCLGLLFYALSHYFLGRTAYYLKLDWFKFGLTSILTPIIGSLIAYRKLSLILRQGAIDEDSKYSIFFDIF